MDTYEPRESVVDEPQIDYPATVAMLRRALAEKERELASSQHCYNLLEERRQQLQADLDQVIHEARWAMEFVKEKSDPVYDCEWERSSKFLASPLVQSWQARQQEGKG